MPPLPKWSGNDFSWINKSWILDKDYKKIDSDISIINAVKYVENSLIKGTNPKNIRILFDAKLKSNPNDSGNRVGWAYATFFERYSKDSEYSQDERDIRIAKADWLLYQLPKTSVCELYKVRFLISAERLSFDGNPLKTAGLRLRKKYPNDKYILLKYGYILASLSTSLNETQESLKISDTLISYGFFPDMCYSSKGMAHWRWIISEKSSDRAKKAIENYKLSYNISISDRRRENCLQAIERIKWACSNKGIKFE